MKLKILSKRHTKVERARNRGSEYIFLEILDVRPWNQPTRHPSWRIL